LEVDKYASKLSIQRRNEAKDPHDNDLQDVFETGGMNWGSIAVYTCSEDCSVQEDYVIIQDSADGKPQKRLNVNKNAVLVHEDFVSENISCEIDDWDDEELDDDDDYDD
jgi:hypothetical protein